MREALFVKQNSARWKRYENEPTKDPDELAERFIAIADDLAYAKTFYPQSKTTGYLNTLASGFHQSIYRNKKEKTDRFVTYWKYELPMLFATYRRQLLYAFVFFVTFAFVGAMSAKYDQSFLRFFFGDDYINMTNANIAKGDPFGVYKQTGELKMFYHIAANNLYVTVLHYLAGVITTIGPLCLLFKNGVMVGAFEYFFFSKGLGINSILVIWIHGTLEISSIIIAGAAGLVFGNSILFPKTYTRMASFKKGATDGMKIIIGILPIIVVAAFLEGFITRHTEMPVWLSVSILAVSAIFIIWYVIIYPLILSRKLTPEPTHASQS
ncbi:stage II sporulation protein M [Mucilaginibacter myungsuensis]|uniref:Stage II sporulation protein M n=1 Tax=Mucilaginibacter myungsuensis TaxID=649104 RepID=A0A929KVJ9_9SPHI|nr:stage II sporulation protein M [Mucilaginibacter myungsuensis]MBE9660683.1 stage II sporulation protein M [Mucilaginibacter myungsuensis]MDN3600728.1 stage II sporulation protein M [Mucilaginibacter myungsuensis]